MCGKVITAKARKIKLGRKLGSVCKQREGQILEEHEVLSNFLCDFESVA